MLEAVEEELKKLSQDTDWNNVCVFIHVREPSEIKKYVDRLHALTVLVTNPAIKSDTEWGNSSDQDVKNYKYKFTIKNDGDIDQLMETAKTFLKYFKFNIRG